MWFDVCGVQLLHQDCKTGTMCQSLKLVGVSLHVVILSCAFFGLYAVPELLLCKVSVASMILILLPFEAIEPVQLFWQQERHAEI